MFPPLFSLFGRLPLGSQKLDPSLRLPTPEITASCRDLREAELPEAREAAANRLAVTSNLSAIPHLLAAACSDKCLEVRVACLVSLESLARDEALGVRPRQLIKSKLKELGSALYSPSRELAVAYCDLCKALGPHARGVACLLREAALSNAEIRRPCVSALDCVAPRSSAKFFLRLAGRRQDLPGLHAFDCLKFFEDPATVPTIISTLNSWIRSASARADARDVWRTETERRAQESLDTLAALKDKRAFLCLLEHLGHQNSVVTSATIDSLHRLSRRDKSILRRVLEAVREHGHDARFYEGGIQLLAWAQYSPAAVEFIEVARHMAGPGGPTKIQDYALQALQHCRNVPREAVVKLFRDLESGPDRAVISARLILEEIEGFDGEKMAAIEDALARTDLGFNAFKELLEYAKTFDPQEMREILQQLIVCGKIPEGRERLVEVAIEFLDQRCGSDGDF